MSPLPSQLSSLPSHCRWEQGPLPPHSWSRFIETKRKELQRLNGAYKNTLANAKVTLLEGRGKVIGPHEVDVSVGEQLLGRWQHSEGGSST